MPVDFTDFDRIVTKDRPPLGTGAVSGSPPDNAGPSNPQAVDFSSITGAPDLQAIEALSGSGYAKRTGTNTWALVQPIPWSDIGSTPTTLAGYGIVDAQPLDADLTALAALTGTNTIYYRSAANTWSPVTFSGLTFSGGVLTASGGGGSPGGSTTQIQFNDGGSFGGDVDFTWDKTANLLTNAGDYTSGGTLPGSTAFYIKRSSFSIATLESTTQDARVRLIRPSNNKGSLVEFIRADTGSEWFFGTPYTVATPDGSGDEFVIEYYDGADHTHFAINTIGQLLLPAPAAGITIGSTSTSGPFLQLKSSDYTLLQFNSASANRFSAGTANAANDFITGSVQYDMAFKSDASKSILFSTDNGAGFALRLGASTGGAVEFGQLTLTTGLSIAIATKTFPLTINGTVVNVLCQ